MSERPSERVSPDPKDSLRAEAPSAYAPPARLSFPEDERRLPWLGMLLDAYHIADEGVAEAVRREQRQGRQLACAKGCSACCRAHTTIPVYPLELVGLTWYAAEHIAGPIRSSLKAQLRGHVEGEPCPFLVDGVCAIHPLRPLACRHFNVFGQVCAEGEDAYYTRRGDVMTPIKRYMDDAFYTMLPFYGVAKSAERRRFIKRGAMHSLAKVLQQCNWSSVAEKMDAMEGPAA